MGVHQLTTVMTIVVVAITIIIVVAAVVVVVKEISSKAVGFLSIPWPPMMRCRAQPCSTWAMVTATY